jgi:hypothetical protein
MSEKNKVGFHASVWSALVIPDRVLRMAQTAPCNNCPHEKRCATGWSCEPYRIWQKYGKPCKNNDKRIPDSRLF